MRLATLRTDTGTAAARLADGTVEVLDYPDVGALLATGEDWRRYAEEEPVATRPLDGTEFATLVPRPEKILCVGLNYKDHAAEAKAQIPEFPMIFGKYWRSLTGPFDEIPIPANSDKVDWEVELGVVIGRTAYNVDPVVARDVIAGYTIMNDVSMRDWQKRTSQITAGKIFEASTPVGPFLVTPEEVPADLALELSCSLDDEVVQRGTTADMIFSPFDLVSYLSEIITLVPGDLIATGTPAGVGLARNPPQFIEDGSVLRSAIEGLGEQRNLFRAPQSPAA
jgi:acylpyruvate hydrolase